MGSTWAFAFLLLYPALQVPLLWVVVNHYGLRNDDGPENPVGYATPGSGDGSGEPETPHEGHCPACGHHNDPVYRYCRACTATLSQRRG